MDGGIVVKPFRNTVEIGTKTNEHKNTSQQRSDIGKPTNHISLVAAELSASKIIVGLR